MTTANGLYKYDEIYHGRAMHEWVRMAHEVNCINNGWKICPLIPRAYGYDNMVVCLSKIFQLNILDINDNEKMKMAEVIHDGWTENYIYWRDNKPWENRGYRRPNGTLGDERRNMCAATAFKDLPEEEQKKDLILVEFVISQINK